MATTLQLSTSNATQANSLTRFIIMGEGNVTAQTSEGFVKNTYRSAGTLSNLTVNVTVNTNNAANSFVVRTRKGSVNQNQVVTYAALATGEQEDTTHSDTVSAGDNWNYSSTTSAGGGTVTYSGVRTLFAASSNTVTRYSTGLSNITTASATLFTWLAGITAPDATEANRQVTMVTGGTFQNGFASPNGNRATTSTMTSRKNGSNGNITMSLTGGSTGPFEDTTHTDTVSVGDTYDWQVVTGTGADSMVLVTGIDFVTTDSTAQYILTQSSLVQTAGTLAYFGLSGRSTSTTEAEEQNKSGLGVTYSNLETLVTANTASGGANVTFRVNGANGNQNASVTASTTGVFTDTTHSDTVVTTDELNYELNVQAGGTSLTMQYIAVKMAQNASATILFLPPLLNGVGIGGPFFRNPLG